MIRKQADADQEKGQTKDNQRHRSRSRPSRQGRSRIADIQQSVGNQAIKREHEVNGSVARLTVSQPRDPAEREAEKVANDVMTESVASQTTDSGENDGLNRSIRPKSAPLIEERSIPIGEVRPTTGQNLQDSTRGFFENQFGHSFDDVRIHTGAKAARAADSMNARAFTIGQDIVFGQGEYRPQARLGKRLLAHELTHVVQQFGTVTKSAGSDNSSVGLTPLLGAPSGPLRIHRQDAGYSRPAGEPARGADRGPPEPVPENVTREQSGLPEPKETLGWFRDYFGNKAYIRVFSEDQWRSILENFDSKEYHRHALGFMWVAAKPEIVSVRESDVKRLPKKAEIMSFLRALYNTERLDLTEGGLKFEMAGWSKQQQETLLPILIEQYQSDLVKEISEPGDSTSGVAEGMKHIETLAAQGGTDVRVAMILSAAKTAMEGAQRVAESTTRSDSARTKLKNTGRNMVRNAGGIIANALKAQDAAMKARTKASDIVISAGFDFVDPAVPSIDIITENLVKEIASNVLTNEGVEAKKKQIVVKFRDKIEKLYKIEAYSDFKKEYQDVITDFKSELSP